MIQEFVDRFMAAQSTLREKFAQAHPESYKAIVRAVVEAITAREYTDSAPDPLRIHEINDGHYQGTFVYVIGEKGYQPDTYWYVRVGYGSCSGCDTLEAVRGYRDTPPTVMQVNDYMTLALHVVQRMKRMDDEDVEDVE